ncbi:MAG TPA: tannase/feruloyl esterase family alpha/beta hydrolase [Vicinamibacterales bacterium]|nr:tannase/feruloyl esterase family alpha/beta hydrolase [Vicinamibacterales bacterium]
MIVRRWLTAAALATLPALFDAATFAAPASGTACANLAALTIPTVTIRSATLMPAGPFSPPGSRTEMTLPAFCRVEAVARPTSDSEIRFEVWIPPADAWNGKLAGVGNGGYMGSISYAAMATELRKGYATASTDTGHTGDDMRFGQAHPEKIVDYAYRAVHVMTDTAKLIVRDAQGRFAERAYFIGCSAGGQQALSEAQRFPEDYDGIVAGDPANNRIRQSFGFLYAWEVTHNPDGSPIIPPSKLQLLTKSAVETCDASDGLKDGLIDDPRKCHFDPARLLCASGAGASAKDEASCLTAPQVEAAKKMYDGLKSPRTGEQIYTGWPRGSEAFGDTAIQSWGTYVTDPKEPMRLGFFKYFLFHDPNWDYRSIDWDRDLAYAEQKLGFFAPVDRDLSGLKKRGGKLLMYTGWMDPVVPPQDTVAYYEGVLKTMGGADKTKDFFRFFAAPGMGHCGGGPGPNTFDALGALEQWVEHGVAPDRIVATHATAGKIDRSRPLCPYPQIAHYKGTGSIDDAASFSCAAAPAPARTATSPGTR